MVYCLLSVDNPTEPRPFIQKNDITHFRATCILCWPTFYDSMILVAMDYSNNNCLNIKGNIPRRCVDFNLTRPTSQLKTVELIEQQTF